MNDLIYCNWWTWIQNNLTKICSTDLHGVQVYQGESGNIPHYKLIEVEKESMLLGARYGVPANISYISDHNAKLFTYKGQRYCAIAILNTAYMNYSHIYIYCKRIGNLTIKKSLEKVINGINRRKWYFVITNKKTRRKMILCVGGILKL